MSGRTSGPFDRFEGNLKREYQLLDAGCQRYGISAIMFRTAKFVFFIVALLFSAYLIDQGADPYLAAVTAILLISGPEGLETWLVHRGVIDGDTGDGGGE